MVLLITYDLRYPGRDYSGLYQEIKSAGTWWHHLESMWLIETQLNPQQWYSKLAPNLDANDHLFIIQVQGNYWGWLPKEAWDWLAARHF